MNVQLTNTWGLIFEFSKLGHPSPPLWDIGWDDTSFDIDALKAHSKQKDIKQGDIFFYLNAFAAHSKQWAGFFASRKAF